jgi:hypothetical protein
MQKTWARFAKDPKQGPGWNGEELGTFGYAGKLLADSPVLLDRHCAMFDRLYEGRA